MPKSVRSQHPQAHWNLRAADEAVLNTVHPPVKKILLTFVFLKRQDKRHLLQLGVQQEGAFLELVKWAGPWAEPFTSADTPAGKLPFLVLFFLELSKTFSLRQRNEG